MAGVLMGYQAVTSDTDHSQAQDAGNERTIDPSGEDVYLDAIYLPLYFKFQRVNKGGTAAPHCKDYTLALLFLFLNVGLQLSIAFKMMDVTSTSYGSIERNLFHGTCWRMDSDRHDLWGILWPTSLKGAGYWDCLPPLLTLAARAAGGRQLDLDGDGFWSAKEAETLADRLQSLQATLDHHAFHRMVRYDTKHGNGSSTKPGMLDMSFFKRFQAQVMICLPVDRNLCGNLDAAGLLHPLLPHLDDPQDRLEECKAAYKGFCPDIFGVLFEWLELSTGKLCGQPNFFFEQGLVVTRYETVGNYEGKRDSILGSIFTSFLMLLLFVWGMLILTEFRTIYNHVYVLYYMPSTDDDDKLFVESEDGKTMKIAAIPRSHKFFVLYVVILSRFLIALVVFYVGTTFLTASASLLEIVLNSTALGFLLEVDSMIHGAFLGSATKNCVSQHCSALAVNTTDGHPTLNSLGLVLLMLAVLACHMEHAYDRRHGFRDIGEALNCLCHMSGDRCLAKHLFNDTAVD